MQHNIHLSFGFKRSDPKASDRLPFQMQHNIHLSFGFKRSDPKASDRLPFQMQHNIHYQTIIQQKRPSFIGEDFFRAD